MNPVEWVNLCVADELEVVAVTDHNTIENVAAVLSAASNQPVNVIPGIEIGTDRGDILALAVDGGTSGLAVLGAFVHSAQVFPGSATIPFDRLIAAHRSKHSDGTPFANQVVLIGAHVDRKGSLLGEAALGSVTDQVRFASQLNGLEVVKSATLQEWSKVGIKQSRQFQALIRSSDFHPNANSEKRHTWVYLPDLSATSFRHAFATFESSVDCGADSPVMPASWIRALQFSHGPLAGAPIDFSPRTNALIGPPSSGKSLVLDSIRWTLNLALPGGAVGEDMEKRLAACLPTGSVVTVWLETPEGEVEIRRVRGGAGTTTPPFRPIVFSQTELTRLAHDNDLSISLIDNHAVGADAAKAELRRVAAQVSAKTKALLNLADRSSDIRRVVNNPADGLQASNADLSSLNRDPEVMNRIRDLDRIQQWRASAMRFIGEWRVAAHVSPLAVPPTPNLASPDEADAYMPASRLNQHITEFNTQFGTLVQQFLRNVSTTLAAGEPLVRALETSVNADLSAVGLESSSEFQQRTLDLIARVADLERQSERMLALDTEIDEGMAEIGGLIADCKAARRNLTNARRQAAATINQSLSDFVCAIDPIGRNDTLTQLLGDLKVGTRYQESTIHTIRDALDREAFLVAAIRHRQGLTSEAPADGQSEIAHQAAEKRKDEAIGQLLTLWPGDALSLQTSGAAGAVPQSFESLTPGSKALAIKELSFAASTLPVLSDQPEDAISTTAVFTSLVPTIRAQRKIRQFIFASHDANIVVAGDAERVVILPREGVQSVTIGTLFDSAVRDAALQLLEGGDSAFERRRRRYGLESPDRAS